MSSPAAVSPGLAWDGLVADALLGTSRRASPPPALTGRLGEVVSRIGTTVGDAESRLLAAGATIALYRQAGRRAEGVVDLALPTPVADDGPPCSASAAQLLVAAERWPDLWAEWLTVAAAKGLRVTEALLPSVLDTGAADPPARTHIRPALGARGQWLAEQNPAWRWATAEGERHAWAEGTLAERVWALSERRRADPDAGRDMLAATWATERARDRAKLVAVLSHGLSMADESFLEAALDDRNQDVRRVAADLLAGLPASRLARRMADRAGPLLWVEERRRPSIQVVLPEAPDPSGVRDGVAVAPRHPKMGERSWWLSQVLQATPLSTWTERLRRPPAELVRLASQSEHNDVLLGGWTAAALGQDDAAWAAALLPVAGDLSLLEVLDRADAEAIVLDELHGRGQVRPALLWSSPRPWSKALTGAFVLVLARAIKLTARDPSPNQLLLNAPHFAAVMNPRAALSAADAAGITVDPDHPSARHLRDFFNVLTFRQRIHDELGWEA